MSDVHSAPNTRRRRAARTWVAAMVACALATGAPIRASRAQGAVTGQLLLTERQGATRSDPTEAVIYLEPARASFVATTAAAPSAASIAMRGREFAPHVQVIATGGSVAFPNEDPFSHNVFSNTALGGFDLGLYRKGVSRAAVFERAGVYPIYCNIHHRMVSFVVAVPTPFVARPAADGSFRLADVPPGTYVLHAWHEHGGQLAQTIVVTARGLADVRIALDATRYGPDAHLNKFGLPYTATRADRY